MLFPPKQPSVDAAYHLTVKDKRLDLSEHRDHQSSLLQIAARGVPCAKDNFYKTILHLRCRIGKKCTPCEIKLTNMLVPIKLLLNRM